MFCPHCGKEVQSDFRFCTSCGKAVSTTTIEKPIIQTKTVESIQLSREDYREYHEYYLKNTAVGNQCMIWDDTKAVTDDLPAFCYIKDNPIYAVLGEKGTFSYWYIGITQKGLYLMKKSFNVFMPYRDFMKTHKLYNTSDVYIGTYKITSTFGWKKMECVYQLLKSIDQHLKLQY